MDSPSFMRTCFRFLVGFSLVACDAAPSGELAPPLVSIPLELNGAPTVDLQIRAGEEPWKLAEVLPAALPPYEQVVLVELQGAAGQWLHFQPQHPRSAQEELRVVLFEGRPAVGLFRRPPEGASEVVVRKSQEPVRLVPDPARIKLFTERVEPQSVSWPKLRTVVDGSQSGFIQEHELKDVPRQPEPGKENEDREGAWPLQAIVGLRVDISSLATVTLVGEGGHVEVSAAALASGTGLHLLKPTRKGAWVYKHLDAKNPGERLATLRDVQQMVLSTKASGQ